MKRTAPDAMYDLERNGSSVRVEHVSGPKLHQGRFTENLYVSVSEEDVSLAEYQWYPPKNGVQGDEFGVEVPESHSNSSELRVALVWSGYPEASLPLYCPRKLRQSVLERDTEPTGNRTLHVFGPS